MVVGYLFWMCMCVGVVVEWGHLSTLWDSCHGMYDILDLGGLFVLKFAYGPYF